MLCILRCIFHTRQTKHYGQTEAQAPPLLEGNGKWKMDDKKTRDRGTFKRALCGVCPVLSCQVHGATLRRPFFTWQAVKGTAESGIEWCVYRMDKTCRHKRQKSYEMPRESESRLGEEEHKVKQAASPKPCLRRHRATENCLSSAVLAALLTLSR